MPPDPASNHVSVSNPILGSLTISGRDLLLSVVLLILGAGAIAVQVVTMRAFSLTFETRLDKVVEAFEVGRRDRDLILSILRARACGEALTVPERNGGKK